MIDFTGKTYQQILTDMLARVPDTFNKGDGYPIKTALSPAAYALEGYYMELNRVQMAAFVTTATGADLDNLAVLAGITRRTATPAVRLGLFNAAVPIGARFSTPQGANSIVFFASASTGIQHGYQMTAETAGTVGNEYTGVILPITAVQGLSSAQITDILIPGTNTETDASLRARVIERLNEKPFGGNVAAYKDFVGGLDGVGAVQVYPTWDGGGTVKCSILGADLLPASPTLVDAVQEAVDPSPEGTGLGMAPIGATVTVVSATSKTVNVTATLTLSPGYVLSQVKPLVEAALESYMQSIRAVWYLSAGVSISVYISRVLAAIVDTEGVVNATNITLNGAASDITLTETGTAQEVPVLGTVTLNV